MPAPRSVPGVLHAVAGPGWAQTRTDADIGNSGYSPAAC
jgi:hypothetical protein